MKRLSFAFILLSFMFSSLVAAEYRTITDMVGRQVKIPNKINRVINVGSVPPLNALVMALGEGDKIVGGLPPWMKNPRWKYQLIFAPHLKKLEGMQGKDRGLLMEKILKARPDIVFVMTFNQHLADLLAPKGIKVVVLKWENIDDIDPAMKLLGEIFHKEAVAKDYINYFNKTIAKAKALVRDIPEDKKPRVLYTRFYNMTQPVLIAEWWIKAAGGISVTAGKREKNSLSYDSEQLLAYNPDIIITTTKKGLNMLKANKKFSQIKAVKNNRLYASPTAAMIWGQPAIEQPLTVLWALNIFYPGLYPEAKLKNDVSYFFKHFFNKELSLKQIDEILSGDNKG